jgi:hypothetical protein
MATNAPEILVPANEQMATEPAVTIGKQFADAAQVKALVLAAFTIIGVVAPHLVPTLDDTLATSISTIVAAVAGLIVAQQAKAVPTAQAAATREAVFAPATVAGMVAESQGGAETVEAVVVPAPAAAVNVRRYPWTALDPDGDGVVDL